MVPTLAIWIPKDPDNHMSEGIIASILGWQPTSTSAPGFRDENDDGNESNGSNDSNRST